MARIYEVIKWTCSSMRSPAFCNISFPSLQKIEKSQWISLSSDCESHIFHFIPWDMGENTSILVYIVCVLSKSRKWLKSSPILHANHKKCFAPDCGADNILFNKFAICLSRSLVLESTKMVLRNRLIPLNKLKKPAKAMIQLVDEWMMAMVKPL